MSKGISIRAVLYVHKWLGFCTIQPDGTVTTNPDYDKDADCQDWNKLTSEEHIEAHRFWNEEVKRRLKNETPSS